MTQEEMRAVCLLVIVGEERLLAPISADERFTHGALRTGSISKTKYGFEVLGPNEEYSGHIAFSKTDNVWCYIYTDVGGSGDASYLLADGSVLIAGYPGWEDLHRDQCTKRNAP